MVDLPTPPFWLKTTRRISDPPSAALDAHFAPQPREHTAFDELGVFATIVGISH
jgi:hypothetical protein